MVGIAALLSGCNLGVFADVISHIRIKSSAVFLGLALDHPKHRCAAVRAPDKAGEDMDILRAVAGLFLYAGHKTFEAYLLPKLIRDNRLMPAVE